MNYKMVLQYDGTRYDGWQKQGNTAHTIQEKLETVLSRMIGEPVAVQGGRKDGCRCTCLRTDGEFSTVGRKAGRGNPPISESLSSGGYRGVASGGGSQTFSCPAFSYTENLSVPYWNRRQEVCF